MILHRPVPVLHRLSLLDYRILIKFSSTIPSQKQASDRTRTPAKVGQLLSRVTSVITTSPAGLRVRPYVQLLRFDRPIGYWLIYWPSCWGIAAATPAGTLPAAGVLATFAVGAVVMRGAACTLNDMLDRDIDRQVARTADRPLACGALSMMHALRFLAVQLTLGVVVLAHLNTASGVLGVSCMGLVACYPLAKRTMRWPQLLLGCSVNWGTLLGYAAVADGLDLAICMPVYLSSICWVMVYDSIYARLDRHDDRRAGVNSTALAFGAYFRPWVGGFAAGMVVNLLMFGIVTEQSVPYYMTVSVISAHLVWQIVTLRLHDDNDCYRKFRSNRYLGGLVFLAIALGTYFKDI